MTERERERKRLIELINGKSIDTYEDVEYVADHLLANGVSVPPCKVREVVWINTKFGTLKATVTEITQTIDNKFSVHIVYDLMYCYKQHINTQGYVGYIEDKFEFGKTAYRTKEEAVKTLKGGGNNG